MVKSLYIYLNEDDLKKLQDGEEIVMDFEYDEDTGVIADIIIAKEVNE